VNFTASQEEHSKGTGRKDGIRGRKAARYREAEKQGKGNRAGTPIHSTEGIKTLSIDGIGLKSRNS